MKHIVLLGLLASILSGCYTQLATRQAPPQRPVVQKISYIVDTLTGDTIKVLHQSDTVVQIRDNQNYYWTRNWWGQPELRYYDSYYSSSWYNYNNYPWWYDRNIYSNYYGIDGYGRRSYYNPHYYNNNGSYYGGTSSGTPSTGDGSKRRTSSSAVPIDPAINSAAPNSARKQGTLVIDNSAVAPTVTQGTTAQSGSTGLAEVKTPLMMPAPESVPPPRVGQTEPLKQTAQPPATPQATTPSPAPQNAQPPSNNGNGSSGDNNNNSRRKPTRSW